MLYRIAFGVFRYFVYTDAGDGIQPTSYIRNFVFRCHPLFASNYRSLVRAREVCEYWWWVTLWRERAVASTPQAIIVLASSDEILPHCARPHCFANTNLLGKILEQIRSRREDSWVNFAMRLPIQYIGVWKKFEAKWKKLFCRRQFSVYLAVSCRTNRELEKYNARRKVSNAHFYENNQAKYIQLFHGLHRKDFAIMNFYTTSINSKSINKILLIKT